MQPGTYQVRKTDSRRPGETRIRKNSFRFSISLAKTKKTLYNDQRSVADAAGRYAGIAQLVAQLIRNQ